MKGLYLCLLALLYGSSAPAASVAFQDAFRAYVKIRQLEEESRLLTMTTSMDALKKKEQLLQFASQLTAARTDFRAVLQAPNAELSTWERAALERINTTASAKGPRPAPPPSIEALAESFPKARQFSPLEWQAIGEWFGPSTQEQFLHQAFTMEAAPPGAQSKPEKNCRIVWLADPFAHLLSREENQRQKAEELATKKQLEDAGFSVFPVAVSPVSRLEDQTEELLLMLRREAERGPFFLVSSGKGSGALLKTFDLHPALLVEPRIMGWLNLNGQLFGQEPEVGSRKPASIVGADRQTAETWQNLLLFRADSLERQPPFSAKFPVVNLVTLQGKFRAAKNLRESLVPEGRTVYLKEESGLGAIKDVLPLVLR